MDGKVAESYVLRVRVKYPVEMIMPFLQKKRNVLLLFFEEKEVCDAYA